MKVGVVGVGRMGSTHARLLRSIPRVGALCLWDPDTARARAVADELGGVVSPDLAALLDDVDAVVIASATPTHPAVLMEAIARGVPALCEKPLASDPETSRGLVELVAAEQAMVQVGFHRRFDPSIAAGREAIAGGLVGRIYAVRTTSYDAAPPPESFVPTSGGLHADVLIHDIDLVRFLTGEEVTEVYADGSVLVADYFAEHGDVDVGTIMLRLSSGALAVAVATRHNPLGYDSRVEVSGSHDSIALGSDRRVPLRRVEDTEPPPHAYRDFIDRFRPAYRLELEAFLAYAQGEIDNPCPPRDAYAAQLVVAACDLSRAEHRPVRIEEPT